MTDTTPDLPTHIAIIMDGNGRWAQERDLSRSEGHRAGVRAAKHIVTECRTLGIRHLSLYTFSQENWGRPTGEIGLLFQLLTSFLTDETQSMIQNNIQLRTFGEVDALPFAARTALRLAINRTAQCKSMIVNLALNYSGREEILRATRNLIRQGISPEALTDAAFREQLYTHDQPDPDLLIRTSGEVRLSNYLPYQCAYSELYFTPVYWPDFTPEELRKALGEYATRNRRFGLTQEQIQ